MTQTFVQVPPNSTGEKIDVQQLNDGTDNVDRQVTIIGDDTTVAARAKVQNADPGSSDYGLTVRIIQTAASISHTVSAASTNTANIKSSAGKVLGWRIYNNAAYPIYVKLFNKASSPTLGTDTPAQTIGVQAGTGTAQDIDGPGINYATGIAIAITKGIADSDNTAVAASDCVVDIFYK